jgi:hypothetical protein
MSESKNATQQTCCNTCDCGTCTCNCGQGACRCQMNNCQCGCRERATKRNAMKARKIVLGLILVLVAAANLSAKESDWQAGRLVGLDTRTAATTEEIRNGHYEAKNGRIDGNSYAIEQTKVIYVLTVKVGDMTYRAEHIKNLIFGYNPTDMVVNDPVTVSIQKNKLVLIRPDGKEYKTTIVRIERNAQGTN